MDVLSRPKFFSSRLETTINAIKPSLSLRNQCLKNSKANRSKSVVRMALTESGPSLAIVGVTGAVGQEFLSVLNERNFPYKSIKMLASKRSAGQEVEFEVF